MPPGYGTLRRDDIAVRLATGTIEVQVLPLDEQVIRLLAPDTYRSLTQLLQSRATDLTDAAARGSTQNPTLVMVTFLGVVPQARFNPEEVFITSRGRLFRPIGIVPLSPTWSSYQLDARQQAAAIYLFEPGISVREQLAVSYQGLSSGAPVVRTPAESTQTTCIRCASVNARSHPRASNAAAQAFAVRPSAASTVTERAAPRGALRRDCVRTDPACRSTTASVRRVLSGSGMPTARCVGRAAGPTQRYWPPKSSSALSTTLARANAARSSAYPGAMLSTARAIPVRWRISRRTESSAAIDTRRWSSESM